MTKKFSLVFFFIIVINALYSQLTGKVVGVSDGDTFTLLIDGNLQLKVRLHGIDAPESSQDFGQVSKKFLSNQIYGKTIWIKENGKDRYGRTIGIIYLDQKLIGLSVNEKSLDEGFSWHYKLYDKNPDWAELEENARIKKRGLWLSDNPTPPWIWRKKK